MELEKFVKEYFSASSNCYGHCNEKTNPHFVITENSLYSYQVCSGLYVSRVIGYNAEPKNFLEFIRKIAPGIEVKDRDIRTATRYSWDLGIKDKEGKVFVVSYWTQNYGASKVQGETRKALFLCSNCRAPFVKQYNSSETRCSKCS